MAASWALGLPAKEGAVLTLGWVAVWAVLARFHLHRQFWHDAWAGTQLITWTAPESPKRAARLVAKIAAASTKAPNIKMP